MATRVAVSPEVLQLGGAGQEEGGLSRYCVLGLFPPMQVQAGSATTAYHLHAAVTLAFPTPQRLTY